MVTPTGVHGRRGIERAAARRRLLRLGASRIGKLLGLPRSVALAGRQHLRHGDLPDVVCILFEADVAVVWPGESWDLRWAFCGGDLRNSESCGDSRGGYHFAMAFLSTIVAVLVACIYG